MSCTHPIPGAEPSGALLACDFETDPFPAGWTRGGGATEQDAASTDTTSASGRRAMAIHRGWITSPRFPVQEFAWYRLRCQAVAEGKAYWAVFCYDTAGKLIDADHYSSIDAGADWQAQELCFRARHGAVTAELRLQSIAVPLYVDDVRLEPATPETVLAWSDALYAGMPPADLKAVPAAGPRLARSLARLRDGRRLRVVLLGDSIMNDTGNTPFDLLLRRHYPKANIQTIISVRGGTGCTYYQQDNRVKPYVLDHQPDLLLIGGISNGDDPEAIRSVIRQVRAAGADPDILILSGAVCPGERIRSDIEKLPEPERSARLAKQQAYRPALARLAEEEKVAHLDIRALWDAYVAAARKPPMWLLRDPIHANERGRQVLARILETYFAGADR